MTVLLIPRQFLSVRVEILIPSRAELLGKERHFAFIFHMILHSAIFLSVSLSLSLSPSLVFNFRFKDLTVLEPF